VLSCGGGTGIAHSDATSDAGDAATDAAAERGEAGASRPTIYVALVSEGGSFPDELVLLDVTSGRALVDASLNGASAIAYRGGALLVARSYGYTRLDVLDPDTLAIRRTQTLPWDPEQVAFAADGLSVFVGHGDGYVDRVRVSDGAVLGEVQIPPPPGDPGPNQIEGLALDPAGTRLAVTTIDGGSVYGVALVEIAGNALTVSRQWVPPPFSTSNCDRQPASPAFDRGGSVLATFDRNCGAFDVYDAATGSLSSTASVMFTRPDGASPFSNTIVDSLGQFWASNDAAVYRTSVTDPTRQSMFSYGASNGLLTTDSTGQTIYFVADDTRLHGVYTIDPATAIGTLQTWNLDLVPLTSYPAAIAYADR
jgi:hypothetical protein